jgi:hypothetical protein
VTQSTERRPELLPMTMRADARHLRPFATATQDLELDFAQTDRPGLVGAVLCRCLEPAVEHLGAWTLDRRLRGLLMVVRETQGDRMIWKVDCANPDCARDMELELSVARLLDTPEPAERFCWSANPDCMLELRLPTGRDQTIWRDAAAVGAAAGDEDKGVALRLATSLVASVNGQTPASDWSVPDEWLPELDAAFGERDALASLQLQAACPWCGSVNTLEPDLEALTLSLLATERKRVLEEIHQLASAYHWTEDQVLAVPRSRRSYYLARTGGEAMP